jgi:hypothetical protein
MYKLSDERKEYSRILGEQTDKKFIDACESIGYKCHKSNAYTDIKKHIDYFIKRSNDIVSVDVKANNHPLAIWVEFQNVNGDKGWLHGQADYIALDCPQIRAFIMISRQELLDICLKIVHPVFVDRDNALRKYYRRTGRNDILSKIEFTDICDAQSFRILKYKYNG